MRLIDADKIDFWKVFIGVSDFAKDTREAAQELIDKQPTAYDVDKVVEQLEAESKRWEESGKKYENKRELGVAEGFRRAIEIVKSGGIE